MSRRPERRRHERMNVECPLRIRDSAGRLRGKGVARNISDGGLLAAIPFDAMPEFGEPLDLTVCIPRTTPNTYLLEEVVCRGRVVRRQPLEDERQACVAIEFERPQDLMLKV